jgi:hypothetical protein
MALRARIPQMGRRPLPQGNGRIPMLGRLLVRAVQIRQKLLTVYLSWNMEKDKIIEIIKRYLPDQYDNSELSPENLAVNHVLREILEEITSL